MTVFPCRNAYPYSIKQPKPVTQAIVRYIVEYLNTNRTFVARETVSKRLMPAERTWYRDNTIKGWEHSHSLRESDSKVSFRRSVLLFRNKIQRRYFKDTNTAALAYPCAGSIISRRVILTAAHCALAKADGHRL